MDHLITKAAIEAFLGNRRNPDYLERMSSLLHVLRHNEAMIALPFKGAVPWKGEQFSAITEYLSPSPRIKRQAQAAMLHYVLSDVFNNIIGGLPVSMMLYAEDLIRWALFEEQSLARGLSRALSHSEISAANRWTIIQQLLVFGLWHIKSLLPHLYDEPEFRGSRTEIWANIVSHVTNFSTIYPDLTHLELPLQDPTGRWGGNSFKQDQLARDQSARPRRVGVWSNKLGKMPSSMTTVHPWLMNLGADNLDVFILSDKVLDDPVQADYRRIYGERFIECNDLTDAAFANLLIDFDLDVLIQLQFQRPALNGHRLAKCHLEIFAQMAIDGVPDYTLVSDGMISTEFIRATNRKFISIPDPFLIFSSYAHVEIATRDESAPFCFGSFNRLVKLDNAVIDLWARILMECPDSRLLIASYLSSGLSKYCMRSEFSKRGVEPDRIDFGQHTDHQLSHLSRYNYVDLTLETFPHGGAVTAADSLYMGVPLVLMANSRRPSARVERAFPSILGPGSGVCTESTEEYLGYAKACYAAGPRNKAARESLRATVMHSILFDNCRYSRLIREAILAAADMPAAQITSIGER